MDVAALVQSYGYPIVVLGSVLEGESVLLAGGFAAHRGYLALPWVIALGALGGFAGDQILFHLGRRHGPRIVARFPGIERHAWRVNNWLKRYQVLCIVLVRFIYGTRLAGPVLLGMSGIAPWRFATLDFLGAVAWAVIVVTLGYATGAAMEALLDDFKRYEEVALLAILALGVSGGLAYRLWQRTAARRRGKKIPRHAGGES